MHQPFFSASFLTTRRFKGFLGLISKLSCLLQIRILVQKVRSCRECHSSFMGRWEEHRKTPAPHPSQSQTPRGNIHKGRLQDLLFFPLECISLNLLSRSSAHIGNAVPLLYQCGLLLCMVRSSVSRVSTEGGRATYTCLFVRWVCNVGMPVFSYGGL